jgi:hypothetical protein
VWGVPGAFFSTLLAVKYWRKITVAGSRYRPPAMTPVMLY